MREGDKVYIRDYSGALTIEKDKLYSIHLFCFEVVTNDLWTIIHTNGKFPAEDYPLGGKRTNDTFICRDKDHRLVFIKEKYLTRQRNDIVLPVYCHCCGHKLS